MRNYINQRLVEARGIGDREVEELQCLHYIAECIILRAIQEAEDGSKYNAFQQEASFEVMKFVEYEMQKRWGFPQSANSHTHIHRLERAIGYPEANTCQQ